MEQENLYSYFKNTRLKHKLLKSNKLNPIKIETTLF